MAYALVGTGHEEEIHDSHTIIPQRQQTFRLRTPFPLSKKEKKNTFFLSRLGQVSVDGRCGYKKDHN